MKTKKVLMILAAASIILSLTFPSFADVIMFGGITCAGTSMAITIVKSFKGV